MTLRLGRFVTDNHDSVAIDGDTLTASGWHDAGELEGTADERRAFAEAAVRMLEAQQLAREPVPVTWTERPSLDGVYRIDSAAIDPLPDAPDMWGWAIKATRLAGPGAWCEHTYIATGRPNAHSAGGTPLIGLPDTYTALAGDGLVNSSTEYTRASAHGNLKLRPGSSYGVFRPLSKFPLSDWYKGSPKVTVGGLEVGAGFSCTIDNSSEWTVDNGLALIRPDLPNLSTSNWPLLAEVWRAGDWRSPTSFYLGEWASTHGGTWFPLNVPVSLEVTHLDAAEVAVRFVAPNDIGTGLFVTTLRMRRGDRWAYFTLEAPHDAYRGVGFLAGGYTDETGMLRADSGDDRLCLAMAAAYTADTTAPTSYLATTEQVFTVDVGVAHEVNGAAAAPDRAADLKAHYYAAVGEVIAGAAIP